jgi:hypothetical protein
VFLSSGARLSFRDGHGREGIWVVVSATSLLVALPASRLQKRRKIFQHTLKNHAKTNARTKVSEIWGFAEFLHHPSVTWNFAHFFAEPPSEP